MYYVGPLEMNVYLCMRLKEIMKEHRLYEEL